MSSRLAGVCGSIGGDSAWLYLAERAAVEIEVEVLDRQTRAGNLQRSADVLDSLRVAFVRGNTEEYDCT